MIRIIFARKPNKKMFTYTSIHTEIKTTIRNKWVLIDVTEEHFQISNFMSKKWCLASLNNFNLYDCLSQCFML